MLESLFNKVTGLQAQVFSCEYFEMFMNSFVYRTPLEAASELPSAKLHVFISRGKND